MLTVCFGGGSHLGVPCRGALSGRVEWEGGKTSSNQYPKSPWISWRRLLGQPEVGAAAKYEGPAAAVSLRMPVTKFVANLWIRYRWSISPTRFDELACIPYSRCRRTKSLCKWMKANFERSWKENLIIKINRFAIFDKQALIVRHSIIRESLSAL